MIKKTLQSIQYFFKPIRKLYLSSIFSMLPYSLSLALLYILIEPKTKPTFSDTTDWMALSLFILGLFCVCILHACIVFQMIYAINKASSNALNDPTLSDIPKNYFSLDEGENPGIFAVIAFGFRKMFPVFFMCLCYLLLVALGFVGLILPGFYLFVVGLASLFIIVLKNTNPKDAFIESYQKFSPHFITVAISMVGLTLIFTFIEILSDWIFTEQVVFATLFSVLIRGFLWPLAYVMMVTFYITYTKPSIIEDFQDSKLFHRNRKQKFLRTAPNQ